MSSSDIANSRHSKPRKRLSREERGRQLIEIAWQMIHADGTEALSLGNLAVQAGVTKPVVYDHFGTRSGLLIALYKDYDERQNALLDEALKASAATLHDRAWVIASAYVDCIVLQGREMSGVIAALAGSPELEEFKRDYNVLYIEKCRNILSPFSPSGTIPKVRLWGYLGAAESLSYAAATKEISVSQAKQELFETVINMVMRDERSEAKS